MNAIFLLMLIGLTFYLAYKDDEYVMLLLDEIAWSKLVLIVSVFAGVWFLGGVIGIAGFMVLLKVLGEYKK